MPPGLTSGIPIHNYMNQQLSGHGMSPQHPSQVNSGPGLLQPPPVHHSPRPNSTGTYQLQRKRNQNKIAWNNLLVFLHVIFI